MSFNDDNATKGGWKMFPWVPDGIYDYQNFKIRYVLKNGMPAVVITKIWLDNGNLGDIPEHLKQPWGSFPDFPPKPEKKKD